MIIEVARSLAHLDGANSREFDAITPHPVVDLMGDQSDEMDKGGTMRLGSYSARLMPGSQVARAYGTEVVSERHRHRYEVNPHYRSRLEEVGLVCSGMSLTADWWSSSSCPTILLGGHTGPSRVQEPARRASSAVP